MKLVFYENAWDDYLYLQAHDGKLLERLNALIKECARTPIKGTGKPEHFRGQLSGWWSRRPNQEHKTGL